MEKRRESKKEEKVVHETHDEVGNAAPSPQTVAQLQSYLGMLNFYHRYLPNIATVLAPLHMLLKGGMKWQWGKQQENAFVESKKLLLQSTVLVHFDSEKELILACDASPYGIGAVLSHRMEDGSERPIAFASRSMSDLSLIHI